jgi:methionine synthase II (cobalamin-independent)
VATSLGSSNARRSGTSTMPVPSLMRLVVRARERHERIDESAGDLAVLERLPPGVRLGVGVVNQKREDVESVADIVAHARRAIDLVGADRVLLTPDCGFATFADNPVASARVAEAKLRAIVEAAAILRKG